MKGRKRIVSKTLQVEKIKISDFYDEYVSGSLKVNRRYQRKLVWDLDEKKEFIDTLLRKYPMPLILMVSCEFPETGDHYFEVIDGLQRLEAIFSFISGKYAIKFGEHYGYFNYNAVIGYGDEMVAGTREQPVPALPLELCKEFLKYNIPCSITEADDDSVDEIFRRINSKGRKLSNQELRQAGVTGSFADLVRKTASLIRGDYSQSDDISMNRISQYSLNNKNLDYGIDVGSTFWVKQGIINEKQLRNSKDEEIVANLYIYLMTGGKYSSSATTLGKAYSERSNLKRELDTKLATDEDILYWMDFFQKVIDLLKETFNRQSFSELLFTTERVYNKDNVFITIFLSIANLIQERMILADMSKFRKEMYELGVKDLNELIASADSKWNSTTRDHLIDRVQSKFKKHFTYNVNCDTEYEEWNIKLANLLEKSETEGQMFDFKVGLIDWKTNKMNTKLISKIVKTLTAMINTGPGEEGIIIVGVPDTDDSAEEFTRRVNADAVYCRNYKVFGVREEANKYAGGLDKYCRKFEDIIKKEPISEKFRDEILTRYQLINYKGKLLLVFRAASRTPEFYGKRMFIRHGSNLHEVTLGSDTYNAINMKFYKQDYTDSKLTDSLLF